VDYRRLRYFVAVATNLHFGKAATRMNVVQSAISQQITLLEEELGVQLLERSRHKVQLTTSGEVFLPLARKLLSQLDEVVRVVQKSGDGTIGHLALGFVDNVLWSVLPPILRECRSALPKVDLVLRPWDRAMQLKALADSTLDVAIVPAPVPGEDIESELLVDAPLLAALPLHHPLARRRSVPLAALAVEPFVLFPQTMRSRLLEIIISSCAAAGFLPRVVQEAEQMHTLVSLVSAGLGVTLVPAWVAAAHKFDIAYVELEDEIPSYQIFMAWRPDNSNPSIATFRSVAHRTVAQRPTYAPNIHVERSIAQPCCMEDEMNGALQTRDNYAVLT
jgi:DNA-binding transcriptional LysR family regulator